MAGFNDFPIQAQKSAAFNQWQENLNFPEDGAELRLTEQPVYFIGVFQIPRISGHNFTVTGVQTSTETIFTSRMGKQVCLKEGERLTMFFLNKPALIANEPLFLDFDNLRYDCHEVTKEQYHAFLDFITSLNLMVRNERNKQLRDNNASVEWSEIDHDYKKFGYYEERANLTFVYKKITDKTIQPVREFSAEEQSVCEGAMTISFTNSCRKTAAEAVNVTLKQPKLINNFMLVRLPCCGAFKRGKAIHPLMIMPAKPMDTGNALGKALLDKTYDELNRLRALNCHYQFYQLKKLFISLSESVDSAVNAHLSVYDISRELENDIWDSEGLNEFKASVSNLSQSSAESNLSLNELEKSYKNIKTALIQYQTGEIERLTYSELTERAEQRKLSGEF